MGLTTSHFGPTTGTGNYCRAVIALHVIANATGRGGQLELQDGVVVQTTTRWDINPGFAFVDMTTTANTTISRVSLTGVPLGQYIRTMMRPVTTTSSLNYQVVGHFKYKN